jgi:large repetitive protein
MLVRRWSGRRFLLSRSGLVMSVVVRSVLLVFTLLWIATAGCSCGSTTTKRPDASVPGVMVAPTAGLRTTEQGGQATFTIVLESEPIADVTIALSSSDPSEGTVSPTSVTFTPVNWAAPQIVTVTGVDDDVADGDQTYYIVTSSALSDDADYDGLDPDDVEVVNDDDETPGITVTPTAGLRTSEQGEQATFTIVLDSEPTADVTIELSTSDEAEGTISPLSVTFTPVNWAAPQTVTVTGVDDDIADGDQIYFAITAAAISDDPGYDGLDAVDVELVNDDDDTPGITVTPTANLRTTEAGGSDTFTIRLDSEPTADVTIDLMSSDLTEGTVYPTSVTFTPSNWTAPQIITVTGVDDFVADGDQVFTIITGPAISDDDGYLGLDADDVSVTNDDDETAGITVNPVTGLTTSEAGSSATFTVTLDSEPTADVTITFVSSDPGEGTVSPPSITFTPLNWNSLHEVTVTGVDDDVADGNQPYFIVTNAASSADPSYDGLDPANVSVTNLDDDIPGFIVNAAAGLTTTEAGGIATFTVRLTSEPLADVTIVLSSTDASEGEVFPTAVTFTTLNWSSPRTIAVSGVDDDVADGAQPYMIVLHPATSADPAYDGLDPVDVSLTNIDNDSAGITVTASPGLTTTEGGGTAEFTVTLNSQPTANVTIAVSSSDVTEGTVSTSAIVFTPQNWNSIVTVTVTGVDDDIADGDQPYTILLGAAVSSDQGYDGIDPPNVGITNVDNDSAGITVSPTSGLFTTENGGTAQFTITLNSQPTSDVTILVSSSDLTEGTVSPSVVTFNAINWNSLQTVTVTGVDDAIADGDQLLTIITSPAISADSGYNGINPADVTITNIDDDSPGIIVVPLTGVETTEFVDSDIFTIVLASQPTANVTIPIFSSNEAEGTVDVDSVTFTPSNWFLPQTITVTGVDDLIADGDQIYFVRTGPASSADPGYDGLDGPDVEVINIDNESPGVAIQARKKPRFTTEGGGTAFFRVRLNVQPSASVTCYFASSDLSEGVVSPTSLTFTTANWAVRQTVTIIGVDDDLVDGDQPYTILALPCVSPDSAYDGIDPLDVLVVNRDDD